MGHRVCGAAEGAPPPRRAGWARSAPPACAPSASLTRALSSVTQNCGSRGTGPPARRNSLSGPLFTLCCPNPHAHAGVVAVSLVPAVCGPRSGFTLGLAVQWLLCRRTRRTGMSQCLRPMRWAHLLLLLRDCFLYHVLLPCCRCCRCCCLPGRAALLFLWLLLAAYASRCACP